MSPMTELHFAQGNNAGSARAAHTFISSNFSDWAVIVAHESWRCEGEGRRGEGRGRGEGEGEGEGERWGTTERKGGHRQTKGHGVGVCHGPQHPGLRTCPNPWTSGRLPRSPHGRHGTSASWTARCPPRHLRAHHASWERTEQMTWSQRASGCGKKEQGTGGGSEITHGTGKGAQRRGCDVTPCIHVHFLYNSTGGGDLGLHGPGTGRPHDLHSSSAPAHTEQKAS
jgi:hypothetical protein